MNKPTEGEKHICIYVLCPHKLTIEGDRYEVYSKEDLSAQHSQTLERLKEKTELKSVKELLPKMRGVFNDLDVQVAFKEGYNRAVREFLNLIDSERKA